VASLALLVLVLLGAVRDWRGASFIFPASLLSGAVIERSRGRTIARWEDERDVEVLRAGRSKELFVRPRRLVNSDHETQVER